MMAGGGRKTVLIVDDVPDEIAILEEILKGEYQVKAVTNGEAALSIALSASPPDLILLDIMMPGKDGFEVCRSIKADAAGAVIPIIFLTARQRSADEKYAFDVGANDYIRKPVDPDLVRIRVKAQLEQKDALVRASEIRYRRFFEAAADGCMIIDVETGRVVDANPAMARLLGTSQEAFLNGRLDDFGAIEGLLRPPGRASILEGREPRRMTAVPLDTADGRRIYVEAMCIPYRVDRRDTVQLSLRDMTELADAQRARDELSSRLAHYLMTSPTVTYSMRVEAGAARYAWISENVDSLLGYAADEAMAPDWWFRNVHPDDRAKAITGVVELSKGERYTQEYRFVRKDRSTVWLLDDMRILRGDKGALEIVGTLTDIGERKRAEEELEKKSDDLEASLREKSALLREVHHRVKNNMQVISSLLSLSASETNEPNVVRVLSAVNRRIGAMAMAHEHFYDADDLERIDFARYLKALATGIVGEAYGADAKSRLRFEADPIYLCLDQAIPAGLIASELVTDSVRRSLGAAGGEGRVGVSARIVATSPDGGDGFVEIEAVGDGLRAPADGEAAVADALGARLVSILADQLRGELRVSAVEAGIAAMLRFPTRS